MNTEKPNRREFLATTGLLAGGGWLAMNAPMLMAAGQEAADRMSAGAGWKHLTPEQAATLTAVVDQIFPPDDTPGAADIGVVYFIDNVLGGFMSGAGGMLKQGVAELDAAAVNSFPGSAGFASLSFEQQTALLEAIETTPFFDTLLFLTDCGMFALPSWGGNRDGAGWAMIGFVNQHGWQPPFGYYDALADAREADHDNG